MSALTPLFWFLVTLNIGSTIGICIVLHLVTKAL